MPPPTLSYGLNLPNKRPAGQKLGPPGGGQKRKKTIFDSDPEEDDDQKDAGDGAIEISEIGGLDEPTKPISKTNTATGPPAKRKLPPPGQQTGKLNIKPLSKNSLFADEDEEKEPQALPLGLNKAKPRDPTANNEYTNLSALRSSKKYAEEAQELDPSIYSYDAVYDSLHVKPEKSKEVEGASEVPRYMTALLRSAEIRKRDQLRARDKLLAKEREAEGEEFADKEKFVTSAYKAQQEELRRIEQEEAEREKQEEERRKQNGGSGMVGFYRDMLSRGEQRHEEVVKAAEEAARRVQAGEVPQDEPEETKEKTEAQIAAELSAKGAKVAINDEGQVVDKRQLLSAGLNVAPKPKQEATAGPAASAARASAAKSRFDSGYQSGRAGQRARQTQMIAAQLEEQARQEEEAEAARQKEIAEKSRSRKTEGDVSSARERYLARKREREEAAKKGA